MRGRDQFYRFQILVRTASLLFRFTPLSLRRLIWAWLDLGHGVIALGLRYAILNSFVLDCGEVVYVGSNVEIRHPLRLSIGSNVSIHRGCYIDADGGIDIGNNVSIAHYSSILSSEHTWDDDSIPIRDNPTVRKTVSIGNDVWIGCGVRILAGVHIGERSVIAAGSVVNSSLKGSAVYAGVPAKIVKRII